MTHGIFPNRPAIYRYRSGGCFVEAWNQLHERRFSGSRLADNPYGFPCCNLQIDVGKDIFLGSVTVFEKDVPKRNGAAANACIRCARIVQCRLFVNDFYNSFARCNESASS